MKVVFPCEGAIVLMKQDLDILKAFYNTSLLQSKMLEVYRQSDTLIQVGNFNYIPQKNYVVLHKAHLLSIEKMRKILGIYNEKNEPLKQKSEEVSKVEPEVNHNHDKISDTDLLSNPFFQTLKPIN